MRGSFSLRLKIDPGSHYNSTQKKSTHMQSNNNSNNSDGNNNSNNNIDYNIENINKILDMVLL